MGGGGEEQPFNNKQPNGSPKDIFYGVGSRLAQDGSLRVVLGRAGWGVARVRRILEIFLPPQVSYCRQYNQGDYDDRTEKRIVSEYKR